MRVQFLAAEDAVEYVESNSVLLTDGFIGSCFPEELAAALEKRFLNTGKPENLTLIYCAGQGDKQDRGLNHLGHKKLLKRVIGGHWGLVPKIQELALNNEIEAYNLPQGVISHMFRDAGAHKPGVITHVGLNTYVDPRLEGGRINSITKEDIVKLINIEDKEYMFYKTIPVDCAFLRGTYADEHGNISMEKEGINAEMLSAAIACRNSGGKVIVQVEKVVEKGSLNPRLVVIPGILVDIVVAASKPEYHMQTFSEQYNPAYSGEIRVPAASFTPMPLDERKVINRRCAMELEKNAVINLGIGMPEGLSDIAREEGILNDITLTVESGPIGGMPASGLSFGCSTNPDAVIDQPYQFDFYDGGGLDAAFLGMAEVDRYGNVNVSKFGTRIAGCGGFINITQNAKKVVFCGSFTAAGLSISVGNGELIINQEGRHKKFVENVEQITFSAEFAMSVRQKVLYVTERAVFEIREDGIALIETAPGIDLERDILRHMQFKPIIPENIKLMDRKIFCCEPMKLKINTEMEDE